MANIRYAKEPPCCPGMDKANEAVWTAPPAEAARFKHPYGRNEAIEDDDYPARSYWMDAYERYIDACLDECARRGVYKCKRCQRLKDSGTPVTKDGFLSGQDQGLLGTGRLKAYCHPAKAGKITVTVVDHNAAPVPEADVGLAGTAAKSGKTNDRGVTVFENLPPGRYRIYGWKTDYSTAVKTVQLADGAEMQVLLRLVRKDGMLLVFVWSEDRKRLIPGVRVTARSGGRETQGITDKDGCTIFENLPHGSYIVEGRKGPWPTDKKSTTVGQVTTNVNLTLLAHKEYKIRVKKATWGEISMSPIPIGPFARALSVTFDVWDLERGIIGEYKTSLVVKGIMISDPHLPIGGNETTAPGKWKQFKAPRLLRTGAELTGNDFAGPAHIIMGPADLMLMHMVWGVRVWQIDLGPSGDETASVSVGSGDGTLEFKGSRAAP